jgi:Tfp pilus assembly protein PilE
MKPNLGRTKNKGTTLVVIVSVVATLLVLLGTAVQYTTQVSRTTQRSRKTALAMEIADGHLEMLFTSWRNIYRTTWSTYTNSYNGSGGTDYSVLPTNYFYTTCDTCTTSVSSPAPVPIPYMSPAATPPAIPTPAPGNFPSEANYSVTQYRIQAVNPMIELDANENAVDVNGNPISRSTPAPAAYGPNDWQYSYFYLAAVDVSVPTLSGPVTAKVRRVFEKKYDNPWTYAMFYVDDLELHPTAPLTITGPIHTNGSLYISTSNFTAQGPSWPNYPTGGRVEYGSDYVNGFSPKDTQHSITPTAPNFAKSDSSLALSDMPPSQVSPYLPFGWNLNLSSGGGSTNDDSYHELIERPGAGTDAIAGIRYYTQKPYIIDTQNLLASPTPYPGTPGFSYRILINEAKTAATVDTVTVYKWDGTNATSVTGGTYNSIVACLQTNKPINDNREGGLVRTTILDVNAFSQLVTGSSPTLPSFSGVLYIADAGATYQPPSGTPVPGTPITCTLGSTTENNVTRRAIRLKNGATLKGKLTIVSDNPIYIQGDYNTGVNPPSNSGTYTSPTASGYTRWASAIIGDSINILSNNWATLGDANSLNSRPSRLPTNTTVNAALVSGNVPSGTSSGNYSGGGENFVRFLEDWARNGNTFCYYGSMVQLYKSQQATAAWSGSGNQYSAPTLKWYYDITFSADHKDDAHWGSPPGNLQIAAYLQQQRWYQVY